MYGHVYMQLRPPQIVNACAVLPLSSTVTDIGSENIEG
jgi:hypothetical protein